MSEIFPPYKLGNLELRNRTIRSAAFEAMCPGNRPSQELFDYHTAVARGGIGMTTIAYAAVCKSGASFDTQLWMREEIVPELKRITDAIHAEGAKASIQLGHCGNMTHFYTCKCLPVGASTGFNLYSPTLHRGLKKEEIKQLVKDFGHAVDFCRECGFDCVEIHAGHAYLISQFISPRTNHRHDQYGGCFENRVRFLNEVLDEVMEHAKADKKAGKRALAVIVKTNMTDDCWRGSDMTEGIRIAKEIAKHKVHGIVLSAGTVSASPMTILSGAMPIKALAHYMPGKMWWLKAALLCGGGKVMIPTQKFHELYLMDWAKQFQKAFAEDPEVKDTTLIYVGGVQSGVNCQQIMDEGFELFQLAHVLIKDPEFVHHVEEDIQYHARCGRSNYCIGRMYTLEMKCHECVERDGEVIPKSLKKEIDQLERRWDAKH